MGLLSLMIINVFFLTLSALLSINLILGFYFSLMLASVFPLITLLTKTICKAQTKNLNEAEFKIADSVLINSLNQFQ